MTTTSEPRKWLLAAVLACGAMVAFFAYAYYSVVYGGDSASYRYKLSLSLDTPDGVKKGYNVVEVDYHSVQIPARGVMHRIQGQAAYVDLGPGRRPLIALLTRVRRADEVSTVGHPYVPRGWQDDLPPGNITSRLCEEDQKLSKSFFERIAIISRCKETISIATGDLPDLVTFADINDPTSIILVDPNNLSATLGPGIVWKSISFGFTQDQITKNIVDILPWANHFPKYIIVTGLISWDSTITTLHDGDFMQTR